MASRGQSLTITYIAWDTANNAGKTGDAGNHTLRWVKDGASNAPTNGQSEVDATNCPGVYKLTLTAAECACDAGVLCGKSVTANVAIIPITVTFEQLPTAAPGGAGGVPTVDGSNRVAGVQGTLNTLDALATNVKGSPAKTVQEAYTAADAAHTDAHEALTRVPDASPGEAGGLATVDGSNRVAGLQGTLTSLDALADAVKGSPDGRTVKEVYAKADAAKAVTDKLDTALEPDGAVHRLTENALEEAPGGSGDWTAEEKAQIREALGLSGDVGETTGEGNLDAALAKLSLLLAHPIVVQAVVTAADQAVVRHRGDTVPIAFDAGRSIAEASLKFTVKRRATDPQDDAVIAKSSEEEGGIEITDAAEGRFSVGLVPDDTSGLLPDGRRRAFLYDVEMTLDEEVQTLFAGAFILLPDITTG